MLLPTPIGVCQLSTIYHNNTMHKGKLFLFLSFMLSITLLLSFQNYKSTPTALSECGTSENIYQCLSNYMELYAEKESITTSILELDKIKEIPKFAFYCHTLAHTLGVYGYNKFNSIPKALGAGGKSCSDGYYHGVVEEGARAMQMDDYALAIDSYCNGINNELLNLDCVHGLGHGAYIASKSDIPLGSNICAGLQSSFDRLMCLSGLFMQYSIDKRATWQRDALPSVIDVCDKKFTGTPKEYKDACLMNIFLQISINDFQTNDFKIMRDLCSKYSDENLKSCYYGIGYAGPGLVNFEPRKIATIICGDQTDFASAKCVHRESQAFGAVLGSKAMKKDLCPLFISKQQIFCFEVKEYELR